MTLQPGSRLGPYEVLGRLGAGGMGEVWRARDPRLGREVAIKVLPADLASDASRLKRFEKEARSASALNHPNIVTIYEVGSADSISYLAMELVEGKTLRELLFGGPLPIKRVLSIASQMAEALARAHAAGIVHRDLKPENVMVTNDGLVKVLDFGLAKQTYSGPGSVGGTNLPTETGTDAGVILGTVGYMSPEQASGHPADFRSDQFSLGAILYELVTGKRAFAKPTGAQTLAAIIEQDPEPIGRLQPDVPETYRWVVERCLAKDPEGRYASTKDLARELTTLRDRLSAAISPGERAAARPAPSRRRLGLLLSSLAAVVLIGAWFVSRRSGPTSPDSVSKPRFTQLTFGPRTILTARFAPDGKTVVYGASVGTAEHELFLARVGSPESRPFGIPNATIASISLSGEMAIQFGDFRNATLAIAPLGGGTPREILENVRCADWSNDGKSLAVVHVVDGKDRLEFPVGKVLLERAGSAVLPSARAIDGCALSPREDLIAFNDSLGLSVVDAAGKVTRVGPTTTRGALSPRGDEIWFAEYAKGMSELHAVTLKGQKRFLASLPGDFVLMDVSGNGGILLERGVEEVEILGQMAGDQAERNLEWLDASIPADLSADGKSLLFIEKDPGWSNAEVYLRKAGGSPVRLGPGFASALSADGKWVVTKPSFDAAEIVLMPTGPGGPKSLPNGGLTTIGWSNWLPDGTKVVFAANAAGEKSRLYTQDVAGGPPRPITQEGVTFRFGTFVSPDGSLVVAQDAEKRFLLYAVAGNGGPASRPVPGLQEGERPIQWSADGRSLFVLGGNDRLAKVFLLDVVSGERTLWREFSSRDPSFGAPFRFFVTPDGKSWVRSYGKWTSNLFILEGVR